MSQIEKEFLSEECGVDESQVYNSYSIEGKNPIPKKCLTCKFMDFVDDELEELHCFHHIDPKNAVQDDYLCDLYEVNKAVIKDAKQGCWQ